tara:strand:- start:3764 stop:4183 length:420 start_codon:yes stop_codon:yes gene_type:complete
MNRENSKAKDFEKKINPNGFISKNQNLIKTQPSLKKEIGIPKEVANRMARRIAITTGIPTLSGMSVFIISYYLITKGITEIPPVITLFSSGACFLVGLIGLSYGILSASWDKNSGSFLGFENIQPNIKRMKDAFKAKEI